MKRLILSAVDVPALMRHQPRWNSLNTLHPFCDWGSLDVNIASRVPLFHNKPCVYYKEKHFRLDKHRRYSICTRPGVLERLVFASKGSLDGLWRRINLANSWGSTWL